MSRLIVEDLFGYMIPQVTQLVLCGVQLSLKVFDPNRFEFHLDDLW